MGDRQQFQDVCHARHTVADYKQILSWVARAFPVFDCEPAKVDDNSATCHGPGGSSRKRTTRTGKPLVYGPRASISVDGSVGKETWGAFFDCYEKAIQQELGEELSGVAALRKSLTFVDERHESLGFGEHFPIEELGVDAYRSQSNRRVEMLLFDPGEEPDLEHAARDPETSELYLPGTYVRKPLPDRPGGAKAHMTVTLLLFRPANARAHTAYELSNEPGGYRQRVTEAQGPVEEATIRLEFTDVPLDAALTLRQFSAAGEFELAGEIAPVAAVKNGELRVFVRERPSRASARRPS